MRVSLFITCYNDTLFPETGKAVVNVLERLGHEVDFRPAQTCCGQMHYNTGYPREAFPMMERFLNLFEDADAVCIPSSSCVAMIRDHYPKLAADHPAGMRALSALLPRIYEFTEFLTDCLGLEDVGANFPHRVTYHPSCHSVRSLHLEDRPLRLLRRVQGLELLDLPESLQCCGFGGTFAIKNASVSGAMLEEKIGNVIRTGAEYCTAVDNSCLMHIYGGLHRQRQSIRPMHVAEILASRGKP